MNNTYKVLSSDMDFLTAALTQVRLSVWHVKANCECESLIEYGGAIEEYSSISIKIMDGRYFHELYEFRVRT